MDGNRDGSLAAPGPEPPQKVLRIFDLYKHIPRDYNMSELSYEDYEFILEMAKEAIEES